MPRIETGSRITNAVEDLTLLDDSYKGECRHCLGIVLVPRDPLTMKLRVNEAGCMFCGQRYRARGGLVAQEQRLRTEVVLCAK